MNPRKRVLLVLGTVAAIIVAVGFATAGRGQKGTFAVRTSVTTGSTVEYPGRVTVGHSSTTTTYSKAH